MIFSPLDIDVSPDGGHEVLLEVVQGASLHLRASCRHEGRLAVVGALILQTFRLLLANNLFLLSLRLKYGTFLERHQELAHIVILTAGLIDPVASIKLGALDSLVLCIF